VAGVVIHVKPSAIGRASEAIAEIRGARVHASSAAGKLVVTLEGEATGAIVSGLESIRRLPDVIDAALVYQHGEDDEGARTAAGRAQGDSR
jgi:nitrate reductase NapD